MITRDGAKEVATTIQSQIGRVALAMIGAHDLSYGSEKRGDYLDLRFKGSQKGNHLRVILDYGTDTYIVEMRKIQTPNAPVTGITEMVYAEDLRKKIRSMTSLEVSL